MFDPGLAGVGGVEYIFSLFARYGCSDYIGERITQTEHMVQCAMIAERYGADGELILAALLHDIGHLIGLDKSLPSMGGLGVKDHEKIAAQLLRHIGFPERIASLVENHVEAKRFIVSKNKQYYQNLSEASKKTLLFQGGQMNEKECEVFCRNAWFEDFLRLRSWDEQAKKVGVKIKPLEYYKEMCLNITSP